MFFCISLSLAPLRSLIRLVTSNPKEAISARPARGNPIPVAAAVAANASNPAPAPAIAAPVVSPDCALNVASAAPTTAPIPGIIAPPNLPNAFAIFPPPDDKASGPPLLNICPGLIYPLLASLSLSPRFASLLINLP